MRGSGWLFSAVKANNKMKAGKMTERFRNKNRSYQLKYTSTLDAMLKIPLLVIDENKQTDFCGFLPLCEGWSG